MDEPLREIVRGPLFESSLRYLLPDWKEAEKYIAAAETVLAADPRIGSLVGEGIWVLPMAPLRGADVWLYYSFYDTVVVIHEVVAFLN